MWAFIRKHVKKLKYENTLLPFQYSPPEKGTGGDMITLPIQKRGRGKLRLRACANIVVKTSFPSQHRMREAL